MSAFSPAPAPAGPPAFSGSAGWHAELDLHYRHAAGRTTALDRHQGPLRVLQRLYPEGPGVCHHVLVHPPGGIVGGDTLALTARLDPGSHALITTPGATRFYRSGRPLAQQRVQARLAPGSRLEWLPLETIAYRGCQVENTLSFELAEGAQMIGADVLALGLPAAGQAFDRGVFTQQLTLPGRWLERGRIDGSDTLLRLSPLGLAGHTVLGTLWLADSGPIARPRREALLEAARACSDASPLAAQTGSSALDEGLIVLRVLGARVEPVLRLLHTVWAAWRPLHWGLTPCPPRIWAL